MVELIALYIVCRNIGAIARANGVNAKPFKVRAVALWFVFEFAFAFAAIFLGMQGIFVYLAGFAGALLSLLFSFNSVQVAIGNNASESAEPAKESEELREAARLLPGKTVVLIGGEHRPDAQQALKAAFGLKEPDWITTAERGAILPFETHIARPDVVVVLLAMRWSAHAYGEVCRICDKHDKPLVRLPAGYDPDRVANQILEQCGERLRTASP